MKSVKKILFVHYGDSWIRGSERCLLDLISHLDSTLFEPIVWTNNSMLAQQLKNQHVECCLDDFPILFGWQKPQFDIKSWIKLIVKARQIINSKQVDLVHVNSAAPCQWMTFAARLCRCPLMTHLHSDYLSRDRTTLALHMSPSIIAASRAITENLRRDGYPEDRLTVVHNGIDVERLREQPPVDVPQQLNLDSNAVVYATVGSLIHRKGVDRILIALRHLILEYPNSYLVVIGTGEKKQELTALTHSLHLNKHVHFIGEQTNVVGWLKGCHAFVSAAREEAFGLVVTEAALANLPIIAPFEGGIPEIVQHGDTALLYANHGYAPLLNMMRCIHNHPKECHEIALRAHEHVTEHFDVKRYVKQIEQLYSRLINEPFPDFPPLIANFKPVKTAIANHRRNGGSYDAPAQHHI